MGNHDTTPASGRFLLRMPPGLHAELRRQAAEAGMSLNEWCKRRLGFAPPTMGAEPEAQGLILRALERHGDRLAGVLVHGSWARGEAGMGSDVDVLVVLSPGSPVHRSLYDAWEVDPVDWRGLPVEVHVVALPDAAGPWGSLWAEVALDGLLLYDPDLRVERFLQRVRGEIACGRLVRRAAHGQPYWVEVSDRNPELARDYVRRAEVRLRALDVLFDEGSWADVVREAQEVVELGLRGLLRAHGVDPPRIHDVSAVLVAERERLPEAVQAELDTLVRASRDLRRDRELAFYGAEDLTPSAFYTEADAAAARGAARRVVGAVRPHVR